MSLLVAIKSCQRDRMRGCHEEIRRTWGKDLVHPLRFFVGVPDYLTDWALDTDETCIGVPDDYNSLAIKTQAILRWSVENNFDHTFLADNDCCVFPKDFDKVPYRTYDYVGRFNGGIGNMANRTLELRLGEPPVPIDMCHSWASGAGYFVSRSLAEEIIKIRPHILDFFGYAEDVMVGQYAGAFAYSQHELQIKVCTYYVKNGESRSYDPKSGWMERTYAAK